MSISRSPLVWRRAVLGLLVILPLVLVGLVGGGGALIALILTLEWLFAADKYVPLKWVFLLFFLYPLLLACAVAGIHGVGRWHDRDLSAMSARDLYGVAAELALGAIALSPLALMARECVRYGEGWFDWLFAAFTMPGLVVAVGLTLVVAAKARRQAVGA